MPRHLWHVHMKDRRSGHTAGTNGVIQDGDMVHARVLLTLAAALITYADTQPVRNGRAPSSLGHGSLLHAHNCYPENGQWSDRIDRALATNLQPIAIEQDVMWSSAANGREGRSVVAHDAPPR